MGRVKSKSVLLSDVEDLLRHFPQNSKLVHAEVDNAEWHGRLRAIIRAWSPLAVLQLDEILRETSNNLSIPSLTHVHTAADRLRILLHEIRHSLRYELGEPLSETFDRGQVFDYFTAVRSTLELASTEVFVVDPYANVDFVTRYLTHVQNHVCIKILARHETTKTQTALEMFSKQRGGRVAFRRADFHDRYLFIDRQTGFQSGASFKDGGRKDPTSLTEIRDIFSSVLTQYESLWDAAELLI